MITFEVLQIMLNFLFITHLWWHNKRIKTLESQLSDHPDSVQP